MKKLLSLMFSILLCTTTVFADTKICKVAGTDGEVAVNVSIDDAKTGTLIVTATNDTNKYVSISFTVKWGGTQKSDVILAKPENTSIKTISFNTNMSNARFPGITISGTRCTK